MLGWVAVAGELHLPGAGIVPRKFNISDQAIKSSDSDKSDKKLVWDVFNIGKPEWFVKKESPQDIAVFHLPIQGTSAERPDHSGDSKQ